MVLPRIQPGALPRPPETHVELPSQPGGRAPAETQRQAPRPAAPGNPSQRGNEVQLDARGAWEMQPQAGPSGVVAPLAHHVGGARMRDTRPGAGTSIPVPGRPVIPDADRIGEFMLRFPGSDTNDLARAYGMTQEQVDQIASDVRSTVRAWHDQMQTGTQVRLSVIVPPLTERERQYILKWRSELPTDTLARIMLKPKEVIDAFVSEQQHSATPAQPGERAQHALAVDRARAEWVGVADADLASGQRPPRFAYGDTVQAFIDRWQSRLSQRNLAILLNLPGEVIDAHLELPSQSRPS